MIAEARYLVVRGNELEGPYDIAMLCNLACQGRLDSTTVLQNAEGVRFPASTLPGVMGPNGPIGPSPYYRQAQRNEEVPGDRHLYWSFACSVLGVVCLPCVVLGVYHVYRARKLNNPGWWVALSCWFVFTALWLWIYVLFVRMTPQID